MRYYSSIGKTLIVRGNEGCYFSKHTSNRIARAVSNVLKFDLRQERVVVNMLHAGDHFLQDNLEKTYATPAEVGVILRLQGWMLASSREAFVASNLNEGLIVVILATWVSEEIWHKRLGQTAVKDIPWEILPYSFVLPSLEPES